MNGGSARQLKGFVTELDISGGGPKSSQLEFTITPAQGQPETLVNGI